MPPIVEHNFISLQKERSQEPFLADLSRQVGRVVHIQFADDISEDGGPYLNAMDFELGVLDDIPLGVHSPGGFTGRQCFHAVDHRLWQGYRTRTARIEYSALNLYCHTSSHKVS
jgi:hypothetical protein